LTSLEHSALDRGAHRHHLVRVHALVRWFVDQTVGGLHHARHARHATYQHQFVNLVGGNGGIVQTGAHWPDGALKQIIAQLLHLGPG